MALVLVFVARILKSASAATAGAGGFAFFLLDNFRNHDRNEDYHYD